MKTAYSHGGDIYKFNKDILDFSANINPLGMPEKAKKTIVDNISAYFTYPDYANRELCSALEKFYQVNSRKIVCGNGAADLIYRIVISQKPENALITAPTFSEYEEALSTFSCNIKYHYLREAEDFRLQEDFLDSMDEDLNIIFLCSPNNPTGSVIEIDLLSQILEKAKKIGATVVLDQCFLHFIEEEKPYNAIPLLESFDNLIILQAATKIFAMAGLRLGYCFVGNELVADEIRTTLQPWSVSTVASKAGIAALEEADFISKSKAYIKTQRRFLSEKLASLGYKVFPSEANYILIKGSKALGEALRKKGLLIRYCENYKSLNSNFYRLAVKSERENKKLVDALEDLGPKFSEL